MALFGKQDGKNVKLAADKKIVRDSLINSEVPDKIMKDIDWLLDNNPESKWLTSSTGYHDLRKRSVIVFDDGVIIVSRPASLLCGIDGYPEVISNRKRNASRPDSYNLNIMQCEELFENLPANHDKTDSVTFYFQRYGFAPLTGCYDSEKHISLDKYEVQKLMAGIICEKIAAQFSGISSTGEPEYRETGAYALCEYVVAPLKWNTWFGGGPVEH